ncbi:MAG TPA: CHASE3 domain-containing protein [Polyangia bacterium]|nr:CHASE3 domain-containing protein [Polyangia bacterium]
MRRWGLPSLLLALVPLLLAGGVYSLWQLSRANEWVEHTHEVRLSLAGLLSSLVDAETGARGYVITGDKEFLEPYDRGQSSWREQLAWVRTLTADNPDQQERLASLERLADERVAALAKLRSDYDAGRRGAELAAEMRDARSTMDAVRSLIAELQQEEIRLDGLRQAVAVHRWRSALWLFGVGGLVFLVVVLVAWRLRFKAEIKQRDAEERFRLMVESVKDYAIITLDREGRVTSWNRGAQEIKGWRADEIIGQHFSRFYPVEDVRAGKCERELETATRVGRFEEEAWRVRKDGSRFWANVVLNAIRDERGQLVGFTKLTRDLTERKMAEEALADEYQRRTDAERESRFAQMFIGILGHDLRNPLNAISMAARLLKKRVGSADPKVIERVSSSAQRMSNMVDQLLDLTRSRLAGGIPVERKTVDLGPIVANVIEELRLAHPGREIQWSCVDGESRCAWDPDRMAQVVSNLVGNALQHSEATTPVIVSLTSGRDDVVLSVHNQGPPIPSELLPHLFEPYRRNSVRGERSKGLGLGLFITEQVVHAHGGRIDVRSTAEEGTTFTVIMPCARHAEVAPTRRV